MSNALVWLIIGVCGMISPRAGFAVMLVVVAFGLLTRLAHVHI